MKRILFIPHHPNFRELRIRLAELARQLTGTCDVYLLDWHSAFVSRGFLARTRASLKDFFRPAKIIRYQDMNVVELPLLHRPLILAPLFNTFWIKSFVERLGIDVVVNGSYHLFSSPQAKTFRYIVDLADLPAEEKSSSYGSFIHASLAREIKKAEAVTVSSQGLVGYVKDEYQNAAVFLPNGTNLKSFRDVAPENILEVRKRHGLDGKWVIGHIGYLGDWVDMEFMVDVLRRTKAVMPDAALFIVGGSGRLDEWRRRFSGEKDIIFSGSMAPESMPGIFRACDVGLLPNKKTTFQDLAFHIKLVEFAAARKFVISSDLDEVKRTKFPNVFIAPLEVAGWAALLQKARASAWQAAWDAEVSCYDWKIIANTFKELTGCSCEA